MTALTATNELREVRRSTSVAMSVSFVVHVLVLLWIMLARPAEAVHETLTEVALLDPGEAGGAEGGAPAAIPVAAPAPGTLAPSDRDVHFRRESHATEAPDPQSDNALVDRIQSRLASLQQTPSLASVPGAVGGPVVAGSPAIAGAGGSGGTSPLSLARGGAGGGTGPSLSLTRGGGGGGTGPALAVPSGALAAPPEARDVPQGGNSSARRSIAGAMLAGPIADRPVLTMVTPVYPEWAKHDGVEGTVTLYFVVRPDGTVKENVLVQKTAGFQEFDENAQSALRRWRFEPLHGGRTGEQWGTITFRFRLREAG